MKNNCILIKKKALEKPLIAKTNRVHLHKIESFTFLQIISLFLRNWSTFSFSKMRLEKNTVYPINTHGPPLEAPVTYSKVPTSYFKQNDCLKTVILLKEIILVCIKYIVALLARKQIL